jgi:hypothetical protein
VGRACRDRIGRHIGSMACCERRCTPSRTGHVRRQRLADGGIADWNWPYLPSGRVIRSQLLYGVGVSAVWRTVALGRRSGTGLSCSARSGGCACSADRVGSRSLSRERVVCGFAHSRHCRV